MGQWEVRVCRGSAAEGCLFKFDAVGAGWHWGAVFAGERQGGWAELAEGPEWLAGCETGFLAANWFSSAASFCEFCRIGAVLFSGLVRFGNDAFCCSKRRR